MSIYCALVSSRLLLVRAAYASPAGPAQFSRRREQVSPFSRFGVKGSRLDLLRLASPLNVGGHSRPPCYTDCWVAARLSSFSWRLMVAAQCSPTASVALPPLPARRSTRLVLPITSPSR